MTYALLLPPFYRLENWGPEKTTNLSKIIHLVKGNWHWSSGFWLQQSKDFTYEKRSNWRKAAGKGRTESLLGRCFLTRWSPLQGGRKPHFTRREKAILPKRSWKQEKQSWKLWAGEGEDEARREAKVWRLSSLWRREIPNINNMLWWVTPPPGPSKSSVKLRKRLVWPDSLGEMMRSLQFYKWDTAKTERDQQLGHINLKQRWKKRKLRWGSVNDTLKFRSLSGCPCEIHCWSFHL